MWNLPLTLTEIETEQGLISHQTHYSHIGDGFLRVNGPNNSVKALKEHTELNWTKQNKTPKSILTKEYR